MKGEMIMGGSRPFLEDYIPLYSEFQIRRHKVRPGVSDRAEVNGRNANSWERKFDLDVWYVDNLGFCLDVKILVMTFFNVILGKGVTQKGHKTWRNSMGNRLPDSSNQFSKSEKGAGIGQTEIARTFF